MMRRNILSFLPEELQDIFQKEFGEPGYRAMQVFEWLYKYIPNFDAMSNLPKSLREKLAAEFDFGLPETVQILESQDGTKKLLVKLFDGNVVECVLIPYKSGDSVCISTQVGCKLGCAFCASGRNGFIRHLEPGEIVGQILALQKVSGRRVSNVSLMGTGEPLDNYDNVLKFMQIIHHPKGENLSYRNISLSTAGIVPRIRELADKKLPITLCISLHFPTDEQRSTMMPINRRYNLTELFEAVRYYIKQTNSRVSFEYTIIKGVNDSIQHAQELIKLAKGMLCHINLIPVNKTDDEIAAPDHQTVDYFEHTLLDAGLNVTIRRRAGDDIAAACGQLRRWYMNENGNVEKPDKK